MRYNQIPTFKFSRFGKTQVLKELYVPTLNPMANTVPYQQPLDKIAKSISGNEMDWFKLADINREFLVGFKLDTTYIPEIYV